MVPDLLSTIIALSLVCIAVLEPSLFDGNVALLGIAGALLVALGVWANRVDYLKWPGATVAVAGLALLAAVILGRASHSPQTTFWVIFWANRRSEDPIAPG